MCTWKALAWPSVGAPAPPLQIPGDQTVVSIPGTMQSLGMSVRDGGLSAHQRDTPVPFPGPQVKRLLMYVSDSTGLGQPFLSLYILFVKTDLVWDCNV